MNKDNGAENKTNSMSIKYQVKRTLIYVLLTSNYFIRNQQYIDNKYNKLDK